ncbi:MAG: 1-acyl-sn-glycerol-3-phosphate acyltransferase [Clostridia bacterium]|nr:1-acyl-sn-glycerol-3-phosphate acyltransferase [Clostridia bacterium]
MKIKIIEKSYTEVLAEKQRLAELHKKHKKPKKPNIFFRTLMRLISIPDLLATHFKSEKIGMERLGRGENCFVLMNHSSFIDLEIAATLLYPRPFNIVATTDGFIGKDWLMRQIGCIPTKKFVSDATMVRDMMYAAKKLHSNVVMYPEAGYSFDGTSTTLPDSIGKCVKVLGLPLVMIQTFGAFSRDPLYNNLQKRKVRVSAKMEYLLSPEEISAMSDTEITALVREKFGFDSFRWQQENRIKIDEPFRADGLERVLYKCPHCGAEGKTEGHGTSLTCHACGKDYYLDEYGLLEAEGEGEVCEIPHIPDWYRWERERVREELLSGSYRLDTEVDILMSIDTKRLFHIGGGRLVHDNRGFTLTSDDGELSFHVKPLASYSVNSDFFWYEIGDVIGIGDGTALFYCFPKDKSVNVAKVRLAAEELYKIEKAKQDGQ